MPHYWKVSHWVITQFSCLHWSRTTFKYKSEERAQSGQSLLVRLFCTLPHGVAVSLLWGTVNQQVSTGHGGWPTVDLCNQNCVWILMHIYDVHMLFTFSQIKRCIQWKRFGFITQNAMYNFASANANLQFVCQSVSIQTCIYLFIHLFFLLLLFCTVEKKQK